MAAKAAVKTPIATVAMTLDRETKNTYRFAADSEDAPIQTLYVNREHFDSEPRSITVTLN
jgi:hypothetical protein